MHKSANPVLIKRYEIHEKKVVEVGKQIYLPLHIVQYTEPPPVLEQCGECSHAVKEEFAPQECGDLKNTRRTLISCTQGNDIWEGGLCDGFVAGNPIMRANPLRIIP